MTGRKPPEDALDLLELWLRDNIKRCVHREHEARGAYKTEPMATVVEILADAHKEAADVYRRALQAGREAIR